MASKFTAACVQTTAGPDMDANIRAASDLARRARDAGADFIALPENVALMHPDPKAVKTHALPRDENPAVDAFRALAREVGAWLLVGSLPVRSPDGRVANCSMVMDPEGMIAASYDKIHMFDVDLANGESYRESRSFQPGGEAVLAALPWGVLGMSVCYDLRFPHLYRALAQAGADFLTIPAAFTKTTGEAHWHVLQRARAIENGCFVIAPCQCGLHYGDRRTFGHSLIVDPWGVVLADGGETTGFAAAEIDPARVAEARAMIPSLGHDRPFKAPKMAKPRISAVS